ncbi:MAG: tetratricopeptide repeat protein [Bradyrhizobiaceae bacterium]|nr:tetratricopeptide repeat protein [Bradyrhizobiaceae bacterium]
MRVGVARLLVVAACGVWVAGCESTQQLADTTGTIATGGETGVLATGSDVLGEDPKDDLSLGKRHYKEQNYGLAEKHFRKAVEAQPKAAEAWVGLAASYDRLRRFDLADRAYEQAIVLLGPTPEILNNQGFSFMLRGDYKTARKKLLAAKAKDPDSAFIQNNLDLLAEVSGERKGIKSP